MRTFSSFLALGSRLAPVGRAMGLIVGFGILAFASPASPPIHIELRSHLEVNSTQVVLGDVARISGSDEVRLQRLRSMFIGRAPRIGETIQLGRETISQWIRSRSGLEACDLAWSGAQVTNVRSASSQLSGDQVAQCAQESVAEAFHRLGLRGDSRLLRTPSGYVIPRGKLELRARPQADLSALHVANQAKESPRSPRKRQSIWVDVWVNDHFIRTIPVAFEITLFAPTYVAPRSLAAGDSLQVTQLRVEEVDLTQHRELPLLAPLSAGAGDADQSHPSSIPGTARVRTPVEPGAVLKKSNIEVSPLVSQGGFATLHSSQGPIQLESRVEVLQDGGLGQAVRVRIPNAASSILAYVTGPNQVEVRP
jgi:flagella basal body P-ring formation protein FlgA